MRPNFKPRDRRPNFNQPTINERIRFPKIRLIGPEGEQLGVMSVPDALRVSQEHDLDLVIVSEQANPPVCKIADYNKYQYEQKKREKEQQKKARESRIEIKEMQFRPMIGQGDLDVKIKKIKEFLNDNAKVRILVRFRGREMAHKESGFEICKHILEQVQGLGEWESNPTFNANRLIGVLKRVKQTQQ